LRPAACDPRRENRDGGDRARVAAVHDEALGAAYGHLIKTKSGEEATMTLKTNTTAGHRRIGGG
jgi:hypothetical protein